MPVAKGGTKQVGPECPDCGIHAGRVKHSGFDDRGHPIRDRVCDGCGTRFTTAEFVVPGVTYFQLDVERRLYNRLHAREKRGYWGQKARTFATPFSLAVRIAVRQGHIILHEINEFNYRGGINKNEN